MRLGTVIGRVTLGKGTASLKGARWLLVSPFTRDHSSTGSGQVFPKQNRPPQGLSAEPTLVVYDNLGGGVGDTIGFIEGREAAMPFDNPTPIDAINAAIVDEVFHSPLK